MRNFALKIGLLSFGFSVCVYAAPPSPTSSTIDPSQVAKPLLKRQALPRAQAETRIPAKPASTSSPELTKVSFVLKDIKIMGNTVMSESELSKHYNKHIGQKTTLADLYAVREAIASQYREAGYVLTNVIVPEQSFDVKGATIRLLVVEGFVNEVQVKSTSDNARINDHVRLYAKQVLKSKPLRLKDLERHALLANDLPGHKVRFVLSPSKSTQGAAVLTAVVEREQGVELELGYNNFGTVLLGPEQVNAAMYFNAPFGTIDRFGVRSTVTLDVDRLQFIQVSNQHVLNRYGTRLDLYGSFTRTIPGGDLLPLDIRGRSQQFLGSLVHPVIRSRQKNLYTQLDFEALQNESVLKAVSADLFHDEVRSVRAGFVYDELRWQGITLLAGKVSQGLNAFGARERGTVATPLSRPRGQTRYTKIEGDISRTQFIDRHITYFIAAHGQWGFDPLLSSEQMGVGGAVFGRGYDNSEIIGDRGFSVKNELRVIVTPKKMQRYVDELQLYGFYDFGSIYNIDSANFPARASLSSTGIGLRSNFKKYLYIDFYAAKPLTRGIATRELSKSLRFLVNVVLRAD